MEDEYKKYIDKKIEDGLIAKDGTPLKCFCGCTNLGNINEYYEEHWMVEYIVKCKECGRQLGHYAYGCWEL
ncbi:hypothetical protein BJV85_002787 [Clostridium acetobutylicum]|uniref:Uncharacterized protein n=1 Tax=Clostridium acetobutylicum (strain ATCC 824 / DSM 792 / JCM 1419 / IAM 19013 / LMG 5710 / NBRC 13948 / NRRL B-527 / VKM B-1787 / 2291 / W) TaxID=272562 RepID=Q97JR2_CLOAB|nr:MULTISPECIES: hypothetical protein [Clostridium]AAK79183.1 Hypothetical protein CA_C1211 [Clostridium acetobutylicum ATCC 824]ADZ20261.1 Conserved hypothetical protein [Clostridium acetobutylicum EA 2018]AEI31713.1 hypothetical protein SMB_G1231 [Clostridium acetobutylicum DSM 1731]AWV81566.1 hypothetical protein DK921_15995 [Clostridium acetobutylicum]MBC2393206.1 hypothetical protein [Clostridium acetobutylicum]